MKEQKIELYADVLEEETDAKEDSKEHKDWIKKLQNSMGWMLPNSEYKCVCDEKGKTWEGAELKEELNWDVSYGNGNTFTCEREEDARMLMHLIQIDHRLTRMEKKFNEKEK